MEFYQALTEKRIEEITKLKNQPIKGYVFASPYSDIIDFFQDLSEGEMTKLLKNDHFIAACFALMIEKKWFEEKFAHLIYDRVKFAEIKEKFKTTFSKVFSGCVIKTFTSFGEKRNQYLKEHLFHSILSLNISLCTNGYVHEEVARRVLSGESPVEQVVQEATDRERLDEFLSEIVLQKDQEDDQKAAAWIEWLLVSHSGFLPQLEMGGGKE